MSNGITWWLMAWPKIETQAADRRENRAIRFFVEWTSEIDKIGQVLAATTIDEIDAPWRH
jgi:hypothetical protein